MLGNSLQFSNVTSRDNPSIRSLGGKRREIPLLPLSSGGRAKSNSIDRLYRYNRCRQRLREFHTYILGACDVYLLCTKSSHDMQGTTWPKNQGPMHASTHGLAMTGVINSVFSQAGAVKMVRSLMLVRRERGKQKISRDEGEIGLS